MARRGRWAALRARRRLSWSRLGRVGPGNTTSMAKQDEPNKVIYSMVGVGKVRGQKQVVTNIGLDGSGEPTLLRIMADVETAAG